MGIAMTIVVGVASAAEIAGGLSWRTTTSPRPALGLTAASLAAQILAMYVSVLYPIAHR